MPTTQSTRIRSLDVLRGVAILGTFVMHVQSFAMPAAAYVSPTVYGRLDGVHYWVWYVSHLLADTKFMSIFALLFGAGLVLLGRSLDAYGAETNRLLRRRNLVLLVLGLLHAHLLWYGDILFSYGLCGLLVLRYRESSLRRLFIAGIALIAVGVLVRVLTGLTVQWWGGPLLPELRAIYHPDGASLAWETALYRGSWWGQMAHRVPRALSIQLVVLPVLYVWRVAGLMLLGMALFRCGVLSGARSRRFYATMLLGGPLLGIPLVQLGFVGNRTHAWDPFYSAFAGSLPNYAGSLAIAAGWIGAVMLLSRATIWRGAADRLAAVGRLALSNYLLQSVLGVWLFYGQGLGLFGRVERAGQMAIVLAVWALQLTLSTLWLRHWQQGPAEWLVRSLAAGRVQPLRRPVPTPSLVARSPS